MEARKTDKTGGTTGESEYPLLHAFEYPTKEVRRATGWWWLFLLLGLVSIVLGVTALASRISAVTTLAAVLAVFLIYTGGFEITLGATIRRHSWLAILSGVASIVAGVIALAWPGITLYVLAIFVGASLIAWGIYRIYLSFTDPVIRPRAVTLIEGVALAALGVLALAWPTVSILVLATLVGIFFMVFWIFSFVGGLHLLDLHHGLKRLEAEREKDSDSTKDTAHAA